MEKNLFLLIIVVLVLVFFSWNAQGFDLPKWFPFNRDNALDEWQERVFKNRVLYEVKPEQEGGMLLAHSKDSCSGLLYRIKFNPNDAPLMSWRWKVNQFPQKVAENPQAGGWLEADDYAARVYVIFPTWNFMQMKSLEYVWDENLKEGEMMTSPYWKNIKVFVAESGRKNMGEWVFEERNIVEDYQKAFGRKKVPVVGAIAIMTDADNSLSTAEAQYKDIRVGYSHE